MIANIKKIFCAWAPWAPVPIRLALGVIFFVHGSDKLFGWFGGGGFQTTAAMFENGLGLHPGWFHAALGGGGEMVGGILLLLGLCTRFGAFLIMAVMAVAILKVHLVNGLLARDNGFEYPLTCFTAAFSLLLSGGGALSIDSKCCPIETCSLDGEAPPVETSAD